MSEANMSYVGITRDGKKVYDRYNSHIHQEQGVDKDLIRRALSKIYANGSVFKKKEVYFPEVIGLNTCVETTSKDEVVMVYRKGREGQTPMVKGRLPEPCKTITIIIKKSKDGDYYILITAFIGCGEKEPWDKSIRTEAERIKSEEYWSTHAIVYNPDLIDFERMKASEN